MKKILIAVLLLSGCASPCMKKSTPLEVKQCKWDRRADRAVTFFGIGSLMAISTVPNIAYFVLSHNRNTGRWVLPMFVGGWGVAMTGAIDGYYLQGPRPRSEADKRLWDIKE